MAEPLKEGIVVSGHIDSIAASARPWCGADLLEALAPILTTDLRGPP
jgi:hypothetical protein